MITNWPAACLISVVLQLIIMIIVVLFSFLSLFSLHAHGAQEDDNVIDFDRLLTQIVIERFEKTLGKGIIKDQVLKSFHLNTSFYSLF